MTFDKYCRVVCIVCVCFCSKIYQLFSSGVLGDQEQGVDFKIQVMKNGKTQETLYMNFQSQEIVSWGRGVSTGLSGTSLLIFSQVKLGTAFIFPELKWFKSRVRSHLPIKSW